MTHTLPHSQQGPLPPQPASLIGRKPLLAHVVSTLAADDVRLLTLTGPGGSGKTRIAVAAAEALSQLFPEGVRFVDLVPLGDAQFVFPTIAHALGVREGVGHSLMNRVVRTIGGRRLLLVLDNFEHLLAGGQIVSDLLAACPGVKVLATSREPLHLRWEHELLVPALDLAEAAELFQARARAVRRDVELPVATVHELCRRLDCLPLAIELAAARTRALAPADILARLGLRLDLLVAGSRDAPERHHTLRATLDWSYALLGAPERALLRRLAVFSGGWTLIAAEAVCAYPPLAVSDVLAALDGLIGKSLVQSEAQAGGTRYRMLETVRQYAADRLEDSSEAGVIRERHAAWVTGLVERTPPEAYDPDTLKMLDQEQDNLRAALRWAIDAGDAERAQRLSSNWLFWYMRGHYTEGRAWLAEALAVPGAWANGALRGRGLCTLGYLTYLQGDLATAEHLLEDARHLALELADDTLRAVSLHQLGNVAKVRGDLPRAVELLTEARMLSQRVRNRAWEAMHLVVLTEVTMAMGQYAAAQRLAEECLALARQIGHTWSTGRALHFVGKLTARAGQPGTARALLEESLALQRRLGNRQGTSRTLTALGQLACQCGDAAVAARRYAEALRVSLEIGERVDVAAGLAGLATLAASRDASLAVRVASSAVTLRDALGARPYPEDDVELQRTLSELRIRLTPTAFAEAWQAGRSLPLEQTTAAALALADATSEVNPLAQPPNTVGPLTPREREIAELVAQGLSNRRIAETLVIGERTVSTHVQNILGKLDLHTRAQIAAWVASGLSPKDT